MKMTMAHTVRVILPVIQKECLFTGYLDAAESSTLIIYFTKCNVSADLQRSKVFDSSKRITGYIGNNIPNKILNYENCIHINQNFHILKLRIDGHEITSIENCIMMLYDLNTVKESQIVMNSYDSGNYFVSLQRFVNEDYIESINPEYSGKLKVPQWLYSSMFVQHLCCYIDLMYWIITSVQRDKKIQIKQANYILAVIIDLLLGYVALEILSIGKTDLNAMLIGMLEELVNWLFSLLKWLMGSPAGLKLNNAFNKMLGKYFTYHIQLWWLFLDVSGEKLGVILHVYHYIGYLGFTFQAAMICDLICIATFHAYCIYVYAARLFNIQVSGIIALMRLFFGRKYNPLRGGIDSCEYTNQELFVGTVAFTMLLLLLPTTVMYYMVFTLFRLLSLTVQYLLAKLIHFIQTTPLYVTFLWLVRSPKVGGKILIEVAKQEPHCLILKVNIQTKSLSELVNYFKPAIEAPTSVKWTNLLSNLLTGKQIT